MMFKSCFPAFVLSVFLLITQTAEAHKVIASVFASGNNIEGEIAFSNGEFAKNTLVEVFDEDANKLGETKTDEEGFFVFTPAKPVTHIFKADLGSGHVASVQMDANEVPFSQDASVIKAEQVTKVFDKPETTSKAPQLSEDMSTQIRKIIKQEVTPLRKELTAYKEKNDLQTILGGIGYIMGLFGLFFYLAARRKLKQS
jgi:nickel transport protein